MILIQAPVIALLHCSIYIIQKEEDKSFSNDIKLLISNKY